MFDCDNYNINEDFKKLFPEYNIKDSALYVVSTPIGNLEEISLRALYVLNNVDFIACEDTRTTLVLLKKYNIHTKLISYYSHIEKIKDEYIISELQNGKSVALVSDAGTPAISDPGTFLVSKCVENNIEVISIPGASALIHSLVVSGFENKNFFFQGFLPHKGRHNLFEALKKIKMPLIIFESKYRIKKTITEMSKYFSNKECTVSRELSKMHETTYRGTVNELSKNINQIKEKGEFVIVINNI